MKTRAFLAVMILASIALAGCSVARSLTTKHLDFTQNLIPERNHGAVYDPGVSDTSGPVFVPADIQITGDVRTKFDKYHGGVDYSFLTYKVRNIASKPVRIRLWANLATTGVPCPQLKPDNVPLLLDVTIPAGQEVVFTKDQGSNIEELRRITEALLKSDNNASACIYAQADSEDKTGDVILEDLTVVGRAHGSLF